MIIKYCSKRFDACHKYRELSDRDDLPGGHQINTSPSLPQPTGTQPLAPALGMFSFGLTIMLYALEQLPLISLDIHLLGICLLVGALGQIITGLSSFKKNPVQAVAFTGFGLFWLSMLALDVLPHAGFGHVPGSLPMIGYLSMWGIFSLILCQGMEALSWTCRLAFALLTAFLMLLATAHATESIAFHHGAAAVGLACGLPGVLLGLRQLSRDAVRWLQQDLSNTSKVR
jgi:succinate-acetate transporter protein